MEGRKQNEIITCTGNTSEKNVGMMTLYHGSNTANIKILEPNQADHDRPYVYMTTIDVVAAFASHSVQKYPMCEIGDRAH